MLKTIIQKLHLKLAVPVIAGTLLLVPATVMAHTATDDGTSQETTSTREEKTAEAKQKIKAAGAEKSAEARTKATELLETKRKNVKAHTAEQKKKSCEARSANINKRATNYAKHAQKHLETFDKLFVKVQAFHTDKKLNVANYDDLVAAATAKQATAQAAVDALKALDVSIDCTQSDPASAVATLKAATANARTALHEYRKSIKDIVVALKGASTAEKDSSGTDNSSDTSTDTSTQGGTQ